MRVLVCGGRTFGRKLNNKRIWVKDKEEVHLLVTTLNKLYFDEGMDVLIEGEAEGADKLSRWWASILNIEVIKFPAHWKLYGKSAGFIRNKKMLDQGKPDLVIAFPGGVGTANMCDLAEAAGIEIRRIKP